MLLFVGVSIVSSTGDIIEDVESCALISGEIKNSCKTLNYGDFAYVLYDYQGGIGLYLWYFACMSFDFICNLTDLIPIPFDITRMDEKIIALDSNGDIYEINPNTYNVSFLGSTGLDILNDIEYDPQAETLWGICNDSFYGINMSTYEATLIGPMGNTWPMICITGDTNGNIWAYGGGLYKINTSTGEATPIGSQNILQSSPLDMSYNNVYDMSYNIFDDVIYCCVFNYNTFVLELWIINVTNAQYTYVGTIPILVIPTFTIPYIWLNQPPITIISLYPPYTDGDNGWYVSNVTVYLEACDDEEVSNIYYRVAGGEWMNHSGDVISFILDYDCLNGGLIEYYAIDNLGFQEEIKSKSIDMDQLPPDIGDPIWEAFKEGGKWYVTFLVNATDACSGIDRVEMFINDGEHEIIVGAGPTYEFVVEWSKAFKSVTFWFYCYDVAGNVASVSVDGSDIESYTYSQSSSTQQSSSTPSSQNTMSVIPSTGDIVEDDSPCDCNSKDINILDMLSSRGHLAYALGNILGIPGCNGIFKFELPDFDNLECICGGMSFPGYIQGGTWIPDGRFWVADTTGIIWEIDLTCNSSIVGSSGTGELVDISYDLSCDTMWGISTTNFYEIDMTTGAATLIGAMGNPSLMIALAGDVNGNVRALELGFNGGLLYEIDTTTGAATLLFNTGVSTNYNQIMGYDDYDDIIYWIAFNYATFQTELWTIDIANTSTTFHGVIPSNIEIYVLAIPYNWQSQRPIAKFNWIPKIPSPEKSILFNASDSYDPDGNITLYEWDWDNDGVYDESHSTPTATYSWPVEGHYPVALRVTDDKGLKSVRRIKTVIVDNNPPDAPTIDGPTNGGKGIEYDYIFHATEPNGNDVFYYIDWGDKTYSGWIGPYANCTNVTVSHTWDKRGTYRIGCLAKDSHNHQGEWGYLEVTMPKNKQTGNMWFLRWLERFPILQMLLDVLGRV
ncbi:PKD domain protein [Thermoplasmatales archaeon SCGC AB-540-F20]|nr:PKD domain protein [Thermoplasmatales archaeon SCGC AB-540-F20]